MEMTDSEFWELISLVDVRALDHGDDEAAVRPVQRALSRQEEAGLVEFEEALAQKLYAIDEEAYAQNAGESGWSDDAFLYMRLYVVAFGRDYYESVRLHPERMPSQSTSGVSLFSTSISTRGKSSLGVQLRSGLIPPQLVMKVEAIQTYGAVEPPPTARKELRGYD